MAKPKISAKALNDQEFHDLISSLTPKELPKEKINPTDLRRLKDGQRALRLPEPKTKDEVLKQLHIMKDGIRALQSLDDLGTAWANKVADEAMKKLHKRLDRDLKKLGRYEMRKER